jgi:hypothetical protein
MFAGDRAIFEMWRLQRDYRWTDKAARRLVLIFARLQKLPTSNGASPPKRTDKQTVRDVAKALGGVDQMLETIGEAFDLTDDDPIE